MRVLAPIVIGLLGTGVLVGLGTWQVQRLQWKQGVLADIAVRIAADPVQVPEIPDPERDRYLPVTAEGVIGASEIHVLVSTRQMGPAFRIVSAFETEDGRRLLLDRGIVADEDKDAPRTIGPASVVGNLHWPDEIDSFTPEPDPAGNIWFARDVPALAERLDTEPVLIVARTTSDPDSGVTPFPVDTGGIPNDHLQYAVTWFGLAAVWMLMTGLWLRRIVTARKESA